VDYNASSSEQQLNRAHDAGFAVRTNADAVRALLCQPSRMDKSSRYHEVATRIRALIAGERDVIAVMATMACELRHAFAHFDWVGFYRVTEPGVLRIGPYQGGHGCLVIPFERGVCGRCARERVSQVVPDVTALPYHIACSSTTRSEIVVPVLDSRGEVRAVLDVDSNTPGAFDELDRSELEQMVSELGALY
jgi:GAF domain-containing protein